MKLIFNCLAERLKYQSGEEAKMDEFRLNWITFSLETFTEKKKGKTEKCRKSHIKIKLAGRLDLKQNFHYGTNYSVQVLK